MSWSSDDLSPEEGELLIDFVEWAGEFDRQILERETIATENEPIGIHNTFEFVMPLISSHASEMDSQIFRFHRLWQDIRSGKEFEYSKAEDLPNDATITPELLNSFILKKQIQKFVLLSGQLLETFTSDLVYQEVVEVSRKSKSIKKRIEKMSEEEREWLLFATGVIDESEKSELRRVYRLRTELVHSSNPLDFLTEISVPSDINRCMDSVDDLHEKLHGHRIKHRIGTVIADG